MGSRGFTLLEVLVAITVLVIIVGIVYASFSAVARSSETARQLATEMRQRQFLERDLFANLNTVYANWTTAQSSADFAFVGDDQDGSDGPQDTLQFVSAAPIAGASALPGDLKVVMYEVVDRAAAGVDADADDDGPAHYLQGMQTPVAAGGVTGFGGGLGDPDDLDVPNSYESPTWWVPVESFDLAYFDGQDWQDDWDSGASGLMPWSVRVRINFVKSDEERRAGRAQGLDPEEDPDLELVVPIAMGMGIVDPFP